MPEVSGPTGTLNINADNSQATQAMNQTIQDAGRLGDALQKGGEKSEKALEKLNKAVAQRAKSIEDADKRVTQVVLAGSRERTKQLQVEVEEQRRLRAEQTTKQTETKSTGTVAAIEARGDKSVREIEAQRENNRLAALYRTDLVSFTEEEKRKTAVLKDQIRQRRTIYNQDIKRLGPMSQQLQTAINSSIGTSNAAYLIGTQAQAQGLRPSQIWQQQMNLATARGNAANAAALTTPAFGPQAGGGGRGGGSLLTRLLGGGGGGIAGGIASGLLSGLGIGVGGLAIAHGIRAVGEDVDRATAYQRQTVAATNLAGSQAKLNDLLAAYATASGNAIDKTTTLSNVTRLMATGFADSAPEVEKFVRATRGASIALGKPQDYVIQETQLAISNVSKKRLDQIGLGIREVDERIEELRKTNANWTRETAFQNAVLDIMDEKYGKLTKTAIGQASGVEKLRKAWADLRLEMGKAAKGPVDQASDFLSDLINFAEGGIERGRERRREGYARQTSMMNEPGAFGISNAQLSGFFRGMTPQQIIAERNLKSGYFDNATWTDDSQSFATTPKSKGFNDEQLGLISSGYKQRMDMERSYNEQRTSETLRYESQRLQIIQNYGLQMVRSEQDFALQRSRGLEDYNRSVDRIHSDAVEREEKMREDLAEKIAEATEDHEEKVADIQKKYQKDREKAEEDHLDRMMKAAGQLDAIALLEERKRWRKENKEREEGREEALEDQRKNLKEQIEEAQKAHDKQLKEAKDGDRKRLEDMAESRRIQLQREDEDRDIQLQRSKEDHDAQLAELDRLHGETMAKLASDYAEQRQLFEDEFAESMHKAGVYIEGVAAKLVKKQELEEQWFDEMIEKYETLLRIRRDEGRYSFDPSTGPNIPLDYGQSLNVNTPGSSVTTSTASRSSTLIVNEGAFQVFTTPGMEHEVGQSIEDTIIKLMEAQ